MKVVIDASVAIKWFVPDSRSEENSDDAIFLFQKIASGDVQAIQPLHWQAEVISVLARIRSDMVQKSILLLDALGLEIADSLEIYQSAAQQSVRFNHHLFDTLYHAVAIDQEATLITADQKYFNKAIVMGNILLLGNFAGWFDQSGYR